MTNHDLATRVFPHFRQFASWYFEFSWALSDIFLSSDQLRWSKLHYATDRDIKFQWTEDSFFELHLDQYDQINETNLSFHQANSFLRLEYLSIKLVLVLCQLVFLAKINGL